jgi:hypothetical protein
MFMKTVEVSATMEEFRFSCGDREVRFRPVVYLSSEKRVLAVGIPPVEGVVDREAFPFKDEEGVDSFNVLEAIFRYGLRQVLGRFYLLPPSIRVTIGPDIRQDLKGFAASIFYFAARNACGADSPPSDKRGGRVIIV